MVHRPTDRRSPVQSVRNPWWPPFLLALVAAVAFWAWQQRTVLDEQPNQSSAPPAQRVKSDLLRLFTTDDYPMAAIRRDEQGIVAYNLSINRRGRVTKCEIVRSSRSEALDRATCDILESRARFEPARDAQGKRVADEHSGRVRWELPEE